MTRMGVCLVVGVLLLLMGFCFVGYIGGGCCVWLVVSGGLICLWGVCR